MRGMTTVVHASRPTQRKGPGAGTYRLADIWRNLYVAHAWEIQHLKAQEQGKHILQEMMAQRYSRGVSTMDRVATGTDGNAVVPIPRAPIHIDSSAKLLWDMLGMTFLLYDLVIIPIYLGWGLETTADPATVIVLLMGIIFWSCDVALSFNTAYLKDGVVETRRSYVAYNYIKTWFALDIFVIALDIVNIVTLIFTSSDLSAFRMLRVLRMARLAKLKKRISHFERIGNIKSQWIALVATIVRSLLMIFILVHGFACFWYFLGRSSRDGGSLSWLDLIDDELPVYEAYTRCVIWVLGHWTPAPGDSAIKPQNQIELIFTAWTTFSSLIVIGGVVAGMNGAMVELSKLGIGLRDVSRQLTSFLTRAKVPQELRGRVFKFAMYSYHQRKESALETSVLAMLNEKLKTELAVSQRSGQFGGHPLFVRLIDEHADIFRKVCDVFLSRIFMEGDTIFYEGRVAEGAVVTNRGEFKVTYCSKQYVTPNTTQFQLIEDTLPDTQVWIAEASLYARFIHECSLTSFSYGDVFALSCNDLADCVKDSPACIGLVYEYASRYLSSLLELSACRVNPPPADIMPIEFARHSMRMAKPEETAARAGPLPVMPPQTFLRKLVEDEWEVETVLDDFPKVFKELCLQSGLYSIMGFLDEWARATCSMLSIVLLTYDRYDDFVFPQVCDKSLTRETWRSWQAFVKWADITPARLHGVLVFLAVRGLGKIKGLEQMCPTSLQGPEEIVLHLLEDFPKSVPSHSKIETEEVREFVRKTLDCLRGFNLPQFLQGEGVPFHLSNLMDAVDDFGEGFLKFFLVCQAGIMCGVLGASERRGCKFMTEDNSVNMLDALVRLRRLGHERPQEVYWGYILLRGRRLGLGTQSLEEVALARVACLCRCGPADVPLLKAAWSTLPPASMRRFREHLLGDGIWEQSIFFTFLPAVFANAKDNPVVGLPKAFMLFTEILDFLDGEGILLNTAETVVTVDLSDLANTLKEVPCRRLFTSLGVHLKLVEHDGARWQLLVSLDFKERLRTRIPPENPLADLPSVMRRLERALMVLEEPAPDEEVQQVLQEAVQSARASQASFAAGPGSYAGSSWSVGRSADFNAPLAEGSEGSEGSEEPGGAAEGSSGEAPQGPLCRATT